VSDRPVFVITGIMAAGKSAVAERLACRFDRGVHVRGDVYRRMIRSGQVAADPGGGSEAQRQLWLRYRLTAHAAEAFHQEDFSVVVQDVILGGFVPRFLELIRVRPLHLVVLAPSPEVVAEREAARGKNGYGSWTPHTLDLVLRQETPRLGLWLDTSAMTVDETVDVILARGSETSLA
jgi:chloramphenicol 3-O-phosphotransferase